MSSEKLERALQRMHAGDGDPARPPGDLEAQLLARFDAAHGEGRKERSAVWLFLAMHRVAVTAVVVLLLSIGACQLPTSYDADLGLRVQMSGLSLSEVDADELAHFVGEMSGAEEVSVEMRQENGEVSLDIKLWGQDVTAEELKAEMLARYPQLEDTEIVQSRLEGRIETTWGGRLGHELLGMAADEGDVESARLRLIQELRAQGIEGEIRVKVRDVEGGREVEIGVRREIVAETGEVEDVNVDVVEAPPQE